MKPTTSFWDNFSNEGRIKKLWVEALTETDREKSLALLRSALHKMCQPTALVNLWLPFLDVFFARECVQFLNTSDLADVEKMGWYVQQTPGLHKAPPASTIWQRIIEAYHARGEYLLARKLATKIHQDKSTDQQTRALCLRELAQQGLIEDSYLDMYMSYLRGQSDPQTEREIFQALNTLFIIDFNTSTARLASINRIAQFLRSLKIPALETLTPDIWTAEGIYALVVNAEPKNASSCFERACQLNGKNRVASLGLLACEIRLGRVHEFIRLAQSSAFRNLLPDPDITALLDFQRLVQWLDETEITGPLPLDITAVASLATFPLHRYVGDIAEAALGRFYLLTGNAQLARTQFDILVDNGLEQPEWGYYAAWAYALCGENTRLVNCFNQLIHWSQRWTIACLLLDLNPRLAEQAGATTLLKNIASSQIPIAPIIQSRLALAQTGTPAHRSTWSETTYTLVESLEALRTSLAEATTARDQEATIRLVRQPLFARLPLADQTFWLSQTEHDEAKKLALLQQAAQSWQYQRAALFLVVLSLRQGNWSQAEQYLGQALAGRTDPKAQLIQAYVQGRKAPIDEAIQQAEHLAMLGEERAYYLLGTLYFYKATAATQLEEAQQARLRATLAWQRFLASSQRTPEDLPVLTASASFIAYPQQRASNARELIERFQALDLVQHQPWLEWHVGLALLWYGTPEDLNNAHTTLLDMAEMAHRTDHTTGTALVQALAGFAHRLKDETTVQPFLELLARFTQQNWEPAQRLLISSALITAQRSLHLHADRQQRELIEADLRRHLARNPRDSLLRLWQVYLVLHGNKREDAITLLQRADFDHTSMAHLSQSLLNLLKNTHTINTMQPDDELLPVLSREALGVARAIISGRVEEGYNLLLQQRTDKVLTTWHLERILPPLCIYIQQKNIPPPAFLTSSLYNRQLLRLDSEKLVLLAWCASFLGDGEQACTLWEEALNKSKDDKRHKTWRQEFVRLLCRQAVSEHAAGRDLEAVRKMKLAAHWTLDEFGQQLSQALLLKHARGLELRALTALLLAYLFPDFADAVESPGRYQILGLTLIQNPQLSKALISREREQIQQEWEKTLHAQQNNLPFLHALSIIYREVALSKRQQRIDSENDWMTSTTLWICLLSTEAFWQYFTEERDGNEQRKLNPSQREEIWRDALDTILVFHSTIARTSLAAGEHMPAKIHARCLALGRQSEHYLLTQLKDAHVPFPAIMNRHRLEQIKSQTQKLLNEWGQSLLIEAEKTINDANSIQQLPTGIRKYYSGGIRVLESFIHLDVPLTPLLLTCLQWYNDWCRDLNSHGTRARYKETARAAALVCERLQRRCDKKKIYDAENREIALHLVYRGLSLGDHEPEQAIRFYEEAKSWGSDNPNLDEMLSQARFKQVEQSTLAYADKQQFEEAYQMITQIEVLPRYADDLRNLHMRLSYRHARELAAQGKYTEALSRGKQALALEPNNTILQRFVRETEELLPEENHAQTLNAAEQALEAGDFAQALQLFARITPGSRLFQQAQDLKQQALQQREQAKIDSEAEKKEALETASREVLEEREQHLRDILAQSEIGRERARAREELSAILTRLAKLERDEAEKLDVAYFNLRRSRTLYARSLLKEACELDMRNTLAKQLLAELDAFFAKESAEKKGGKS